MWPNQVGYNPYIIPHKILSTTKATIEQLQIGPNSEELVLDQNDPVLYHVRSDSLGKLSVVGEYTITQKEPEPDRLDVIERQLAAIMEKLNGESNTVRHAAK